MERRILIPNSEGNTANQELILIDNLVIVGANGSGKSRLGSRIEHNTSDRPVKRISAQRLLQVPDRAQQRTLIQSLHELVNNLRNKSVIDLQNDYELALSTIFAQTGKRNEDYVELCKNSATDKIPPVPESSIEKLIKIWNDVLPQRQLKIEDNTVTVIIPGAEENYVAKEMSDGEKVSLYLMAQTLSLPENCVVIIDEPELHLHKALMARLWNKIEQERPDCIFIYITHDLDFAASRVKATKLWVKSFKPNVWTWELVPNSEDIPENLILEIVGSRRPILFVEGERGSYDHAIYQFVYPEYTIIPRGNSSKVIESVRGIRGNANLHSINAFGLVDRDYKTDEEVKAIAKEGLFVLDFAEVENLLLISELIMTVARNQANNEVAEFEKVKQFVLDELKGDFDRIVSYRTSLIVNFKLNAFDTKQIGESYIKNAIGTLVASIDVSAIYKENHDLYSKLLSETNYEEALKYYNNKGLVSRVSGLLGLGNGQYAQLILRLLNIDERKPEIIAALKKYLPEVI